MRTHLPDAGRRRTPPPWPSLLALALALMLTPAAFAQRPADKAAKSPAPKAAAGHPAAATAPKAAEAPKPAEAAAGLARYVPRDGLRLYIESTGLDEHADSWRRTAAYHLLNQTVVGRVLEDCLVDFLRSRSLEADGPPVTTAELRTVVEHVARNGFVLALSHKAPGAPSAPVVLRGAGREAVHDLFARFLTPAHNLAPVTTVVEGRKVGIFKGGPREWCWWFEGEDLVLEFGSAAPSVILETLAGKRPNASAHPLHAPLLAIEDGFEPTGLAFLDMTELRDKVPPQAAALGLADLKHVDYRWGFQDEALMGVLRLAAPAPRKGILALFDGPGFDAKGVSALPPGVTGFTAATLDFGKLYDRAVALAKEADPRAADRITALEQAARDALGGLRLREDVLARLGPKTTIYSRKPDADRGVPHRPAAPPRAGATDLPELIFSTQVDNASTFGRTLDRLMTAVNQSLADSHPGREPRDEGATQRGPAAESGGEFQKAPGRGTSYTLERAGAVGPAAALVPPGLTVTLGKNHLVVASSPEAAQLALAVESRGAWVPGRDFKAVAEHLPKRMALLVVTDPRDSVPSLVAGLPDLVHLLNQAPVASRLPAPARDDFAARMAAVQAVGKSSTEMMEYGKREAQARAAHAQAPRPEPEVSPPPGGPPKPSATPREPIPIDPEALPRADDLRKYLFPGSITLTADNREVRVVARASVPTLPGGAAAGGTALGLILPAIQSAREASRRAVCTNNLKQVGLALHNFAADNPRLPPAATAGADGKPLLSWRVAILPYLGEAALYHQFKQDEPWDGPTNVKLIPAMPRAFACPSTPSAAAGSTTYRAIVGKGAGFEGTKGLTLKDFADGAANTLLVVEAGEAVPWTKPDELPAAADPARPLPGFGSPHAPGGGAAGGANGLFADGSVRFLRGDLSPRTFNALTTRDGGEPLDPSSF